MVNQHHQSLGSLHAAGGITALLCLILSQRSSFTGSYLLGLLDELLVTYMRIKTKSFAGGVGCEKAYHASNHTMLTITPEEILPENVHLDSWQDRGRIKTTTGHFSSPIAHNLPRESGIDKVHFEIVISSDTDFETVVKEGRPIIIHLPATGDEGFDERRFFFADPLAVEHGITSILVLVPFYGARRLKGQSTYALDKVEYFSGQCLGAVMESNALVQWLTQTLGFSGKLGFTGVSFGGSMSALSSLFCPIPHVAISHIPANGPADAYVLGALSKTVDWSLFDNGKKTVAELLKTMDIGDASLWVQEHFTREENSQKHPRRVFMQLSGKHDRYIPKHRADKLFRRMKALPNMQYAEYQELPGGHVTAFLFHRTSYISAIAKALATLEL